MELHKGVLLFLGVLILKSPMIITGTFLHPVNIFCIVVYNSTVLVCGLLYVAITTNFSIPFCRTSFMASTLCPGYVIALDTQILSFTYRIYGESEHFSAVNCYSLTVYNK